MARQALFLLLTLAHGAQLGMQWAAAQQGPSCNTFYTPGGQEEHDANDVEAKAGLVPLEDTLKEPLKSKIWDTRPWRTHFVIVTGHVGEFDRHIPAWMVHIASHPKFSFYVYQRSQPSEPRYSPNRGKDGGFFLQFVHEFYYDLPNVTLLLHGNRPLVHNYKLMYWLQSLRPNVSYTHLNTEFAKRSMDLWVQEGTGTLMEQCFRNVLQIAGQPWPAKQNIVVATYLSSQWAISRERLQERSYDFWEEIYHLWFHTKVPCSHGSLQLDTLYTAQNPGQPMSLNATEDQRPGGHYTHILAGATEHLGHVLLNQEPPNSEPYTRQQYCSNFYPSTECKHSPCVTGMHSYMIDMMGLRQMGSWGEPHWRRYTGDLKEQG